LRHAHIITTKTTTTKRRRLMMIVLVYGEIKKNGRGETHISKVESAGRRA
jgi:hypothetical protein